MIKRSSNKSHSAAWTWGWVVGNRREEAEEEDDGDANGDRVVETTNEMMPETYNAERRKLIEYVKMMKEGSSF